MTTTAAKSMPRVIPAGRDLTLDLVRVACVLLVVFVHVLFTGVGQGSDGSLLIEKTVEAQPWFAAASWIANIMPLFFVVGGYAAKAGWRSAVARGENADAFVRVRLARLARPALPLFLFFAAALGTTRLLGIDPGLVDAVAVGVGSPLWFLAAYMIVQALAPIMMRLHERHGAWILLMLFAASAAVDAFRFLFIGGVLGIEPVDAGGYGLGQELFGIPNVVFVWLFAQQVGFFLYDKWFERRTKWQLTLMIAAGYALLWGLVSLGGYSQSMLGNQWPPTVTMAVLAVIQASALTFLHAPLTALMRTRVAQGVVFLVGSRLMTIYLWHLPLIMVLVGIELLLPLPLPTPGSATWWWTRPLFFLVVMIAVLLLAQLLGRFEKVPRGMPRHRSAAATVGAVFIFIAPLLAITAYGLDFALAAAAAAGTAIALWLTRLTRSTRSTPAIASAES